MNAKAYANGLPSQAQKAQAAFRSAMAVGESANTPPEETAAGQRGDGRFLPSLHIDLRYLGILKGWNFMSRNFVGNFDLFSCLVSFGFAFAKVNWPFDQSFNMTLPQEKSFERYEELLVRGPQSILSIEFPVKNLGCSDTDHRSCCVW